MTRTAAQRRNARYDAKRGAYYTTIAERVTERRHLDALLIAWRNSAPDLQFNTVGGLDDA